MFNINFADDWIRTTDMWCWKLPLYQLATTTALLPLILYDTFLQYCVQNSHDYYKIGG